MLKQYQEKINDYLSKFGAGYRIIETTDSFVGGKPSLSYRISINSKSVELKTTKTTPTPCFRNTLSSGDRSTLAFAFFLSRLDLDQNLQDKAIIFDDPITSLDSNRTTCTQQQITRIARIAPQVIVLSHDPYFLRMLWESSDKSDIKPLWIKRAAEESSIISEWNIERETQGEYFKNYSALIEYLESGTTGDLRAVARCIRPLLEGNLRIRFPGQFGRNEWLGTFLEKINSANAGELLANLKSYVGELSDINDYSKHFHHDQNPNADSYPITDGELRTFVDRTLKVISGVLGVSS